MIENTLAGFVKIRILRLLFEFPNRQFSTKNIINECMSGSGAVQRALKELLREKTIEVKKNKKEKLYSLNKDNWLYKELYELFQKEKMQYPAVSYFHRMIFADLKCMLAEAQKIIIFGSVASGTATRMSDMDVFIVAEKKESIMKKINYLEKKYKIRFEAVLLSERELNTFKKKKSKLLENIEREHIELV